MTNKICVFIFWRLKVDVTDRFKKKKNYHETVNAFVRLENKPPMPYEVWEEKLRVRVRQWYKVLQDNELDVDKVIGGYVHFGFRKRNSVLPS